MNIPCETTATRKVTVKPLIHTLNESFLAFVLYKGGQLTQFSKGKLKTLHTTAGTILIIVSLIDIFASDASKN